MRVVDVLRLFVAFAPGEASREALARETRRVAAAEPALRATRAEGLHWTVAFLGATPASEVAAIEAVLRSVASEFEPFSVTIAGLGAFPSGRRPRVVWAGLVEDEGRARMVAIAQRLAAALGAAGYTLDAGERFHPHLTLGRLDGPPRGAGGSLEKLLTTGTLQRTYSPEVLSDLLFMVSENDGRGTRYRPLAAMPLGRKGPPRESGAGA